MKKSRTYLPVTIDAVRLLGTEVARARRLRRWSTRELAERAGITPGTLGKIERGEPTVAMGIVFEVAALAGVRLFDLKPAEVSSQARASHDRLAVLPQRVRRPVGTVVDDF